MSSAKPTKKNNPCPVCGDISGKCRPTETELVLCMNTLDESSTPTGWKFLGLTGGGGQWGKIVPAGQPESGNAKALREQRAAERAAVEAARIARLKPKEVRDSDYWHLVANCPILEADRADLTRRGLTDDDLAKLTPINDGRGGYVIPIRDRDGLMVGGQRRLSDAASGGKYRWATNGENHIPPTNELPLAHWQHSPHVQSIVLMDGTGVKPYLAAKRLNALAIGASGGSYTSSLKTFKATLDRFSDLPIRFTPDAGDVENHSVMHRLLDTYRLVKSFGREMQIAWWGQMSKATHQDVDEITPETEIHIIGWPEFVAIAIPALEAKGKNVEFLRASALVPEAVVKTTKKAPSKFESSIETGLIIPGGGDKSDVRVGNHLEAIANVTTPEGEGVVLQFTHRRGFKTCTMTLYREDLAGDGLVTLRALARQGFDWNYHQKDSLLEALHQLGRGEIPEATITNKTGWHGKTYVTAHKTYGDQSIRFRDWEVSSDALTEIVGTPDGWRRDVGAKCEGNSRLVLALGTGFSAPLIRLIEIAESGGVHIYGDSSEGKTTSAKVLLSINGEKTVQTWNQTINGLEGTAEAHSDSVMVLDEMHQCSDPKKAGKIAYDLANEEGKVRAKVTGDAKKSKNWKIGYFSTGEVSLPAFLKAAGITIKAGQEVRMPSIPASPRNAPFGCFETIHGAESAERFAMDLEASAAANRGIAGDLFLSRLVVDAQSEGFTERLTTRIREIAEELTVGIENNAVKRVGMKRFALYLCSIELAIDYGIVPFTKESAGKSIKKCWQDWLDDRGGDGSRDVKEAVANFLQSIERNLLTSRVFDPSNSSKPLTNVLGYWVRSDRNDGLLCIPPATFEAEFCKEVKKSALVKELIRLGVLMPRADGKSTSQQMPEPNQKQKRHYFVVNLEVSKKIGDFSDSGDSDHQKAELERLLAENKKGDSQKQKVIPVILSGENAENLSPESLESPGEKKVIQKGIPRSPDLASDTASQITKSPESLKKQGNSQKEQNLESEILDSVSTEETELADSIQLGNSEDGDWDE
jgi:uncharacterized protein (DUF927 family)